MSSAEAYYRFENAGNCLVITLLPELNDKQWADIELVGSEILNRLSGSKSPKLLLDLTQLSYMGSAMVALIVRVYKSVNGLGGQMVVVNTHPLVLEVLKLAGLTKLWTIVDSREKAFSTLGARGRNVGPAEGASGDGNLLLIAGIIGAIGAITGLALEFRTPPLVSLKIAKLIEVGFAALGIIVGTVLLAKQMGMRRNIGIALLAICVLVILGGIVAAPERRAAPASSAPAVQTSIPETTKPSAK